MIDRILEQRGSDTVRVTKVKNDADEDMVQAGLGTMRRMRLLILVAGKLILLLLMLRVTFLVFVDFGIL